MTEALRAIVAAHHERLPTQGASVLDLIHLCALARAQARRLATHGSDGATDELERLVRAVELLADSVDAPGRELRTVVGATLGTVDRLLEVVRAPQLVASSAASLVPPLAPRRRPAAERVFLVLASGRALALDPSGAAGPEVELASSRPVCAARTESGIVTAHEDGTLVAARASGTALTRLGVARAPGRAWRAIAPVRRAGERCIATIDEAGVVELRSPDLGELIETFRLDVGAPVAMIGDVEALVVAFEQGPLRRIRPVSPRGWEAFPAPPDGSKARSICGPRGGLVVLTDSGKVLVYDAREPRAAACECDVGGRRAVCAAPLDDDSAVIADETGALWRAARTTGRAEQMPASLGRAPVSLARARDALVAAYEGSSVEIVPLGEPRSGPPRTFVSSAPIVSLVQ